MLWAVCKDPGEGIVGVGECSEHSLPLPSVDPQWRGPDPGQVETGCPVFLSKPAGDRGSRSRCDVAATAGRLAQLWAEPIRASPWGLPPWRPLQAGVSPKPSFRRSHGWAVGGRKARACCVHGDPSRRGGERGLSAPPGRARGPGALTRRRRRRRITATP